METPFVPQDEQQQQDEAYFFFHRDTFRRLSRVVELACAYFVFALFLFFRLVCPGGYQDWQWFMSPFWWVAVFSPLFCIDIRNFQHARYLKKNQDRFVPLDSLRYHIIIGSEFLFKVFLCVWLAAPAIHKMSLKIVMLPYVCGYVVHFVLGHFVPIEEDLVRAEGCNAVAWLTSELGRFLEFVLLISLALKAGDNSNHMYSWQAAFWPGWGLVGLVGLIVCLVVPFCVVSAFVHRPRTLMLTWIILVALGLAIATGLSITNLSSLLKDSMCPGDIVGDLGSTEEELIGDCRAHIAGALAPWLLFLSLFALVTTVLKRQLSQTLHDAWYQVPVVMQDQGGQGVARLVPEIVEVLPAPELMFRITPTYYARQPVLDDLPESLGASSLGNSSVVVAQITGGSHYSAVPSSLRGTYSMIPSTREGASTAAAGAGLGISVAPGSVWQGASTFATMHRLSDHAGSVMSARGGAYAELVESEQLCFICYDQFPDGILLECGHAGMCAECATRMMDRARANCPICRTVISQVARMLTRAPVPKALFRTASSAAFEASPRDSDPESGEGSREGTQTLGPPWPLSTRKLGVVVEIARVWQPRREGRPRQPRVT